MHRRETPNQTRFLTFSCYDRRPLFGNALIRDLFVEHLEKARLELGFVVYAWVVMPEHVHLLVLPRSEGAGVPTILSRIKRPLALKVIRRWRELNAPILRDVTDSSGLTRFWQKGGGYDRNMRDQDE